MLRLLYLGLNGLLVVAIGISLISWLVLIRNRMVARDDVSSHAIIPIRQRARPYWNPFDLLILIGAFLVISQLMLLWMVSIGWMEMPNGEEAPTPTTITGQLAPILVTSAAGLGATAITILWMRLFDRDAVRKLGLTGGWDDLWLGLKGALMILPPVMMIAAAVSRFVPYEHDVLKSLAHITNPVVFMATLVGTALVAPLFEEFMFRVVLQGGLQGWADRSGGIGDEAPEDQWQPRAYWPVVLSSLIFAAMHIGGQGAAPIPLFFLALGLGYLYRQTGCIIAPFVVHAVLNGLTLTVEMLKLQMG